MSWCSLPGDIRLLVLEKVAVDCASVAPYAAVCQEWQSFFEPRTFSTISIEQRQLTEFDAVLRGHRRQYLRTLRLTIVMDEASEPMLSEERRQNPEPSEIFTWAIWRLFRLLSDWTDDGVDAIGNGGLTLHFILLPSWQLESMFPYFAVEGSGNEESALAALFADVSFNSSYLPVTFADAGLPKLHVVRRLCHLHEQIRGIDVATMSLIMSKLGGLERVNHEPNRKFSADAQRTADEALASDLEAWPPSLKTLTIYEEAMVGMITEVAVRDTKSSNLTWALLRRSQLLEKMAISNVVDAEDFFSYALKDPSVSWPELSWLTLTSEAIRQKEDPDRIDQLLLAAGCCAERMPRLENMELYFISPEGTGYFQYLTRDGAATVNWTSTWSFQLGHKVTEIWTNIAERRTNRPAKINNRQLSTAETWGVEAIQIIKRLATQSIVVEADWQEHMSKRIGYSY